MTNTRSIRSVTYLQYSTVQYTVQYSIEPRFAHGERMSLLACNSRAFPIAIHLHLFLRLTEEEEEMEEEEDEEMDDTEGPAEDDEWGSMGFAAAPSQPGPLPAPSLSSSRAPPAPAQIHGFAVRCAALSSLMI